MRTNSSQAVLALLLTTGLVSAADHAQSPTRPGSEESRHYSTALGEIEVVLVADNQQAMIGEPVYLSFTVRNLSGNDLQTVQDGNYRNRFGRPESYSVTVVDQNGKALPVLDAGPSFGRVTGRQKIPANDTWVRRLFLPHWVKLAAAGDYVVTCKTVLKLSKHTPGKWDYNEKTTDINIEVNTPLKVVPTDKKRMGKLIKVLGDRMFDKNSDASGEATRSLAWIEDERVIPIFNKAMATADYSLRFAALNALAKFNSDDALQGIKVGLATQASDMRAGATTDAVAGQLADSIRHSAALALSRSQHPQATKLLLSLWQDPYYAVRIDVLPALGKMDSAESLELLRKMSTDANETVRNEAQRYLKLRREKPKARQAGKPPDR